MPYTNKKRRNVLLEHCGDLNQTISSQCGKYILLKGERYQHYNDVMSVLSRVEKYIDSYPEGCSYRIIDPEDTPQTKKELYDNVLYICLRYRELNGDEDIDGALRGAGAEIYRRLIGPYEDLAIAKNGDLDEYAEILKKREVKNG